MPTEAPKRKPARKSRETYRRSERAKLRAAENATPPPAKFALVPAKRDAWLAALVPPDAKPDDDDVAAFEDVQALAVAEALSDGRTLVVAKFLDRFAASLVAAVGGVARGLRVDEWETRAGMTYSRVNVLAKLDAPGFGQMWSAAWRVRKEGQAMRVREKAVERAVEGDEVPIVGRVDQYKDEIIGHRRQFSDRMQEYLIDEAKPVEERVNPGKPAAPQINVGQIVYNIPNLPADVAARVLAPAAEPQKKVVDVTPS